MPAIAITAVNTGTEALTAIAHGLLTGDRFRLRNIGGALPAATPALAPVTDYFAIRVDADNIKVAITNSDALAGTAVNITGAGTGTHIVEYGLPYCVPRIAGALTQIFHDDDNNAWQSLVAIYDLLTGQAQSIFTGVTLAGDLTVNGLIKRTWTRTFFPQWIQGLVGWTPAVITVGSATKRFWRSNASFTTSSFDVPFEDGDRITGISFEAVGDGAVDSTWTVLWSAALGTAAETELGSITVTNHPTAATLVTVAGPGGTGTFTAKTLAAGDQLTVVATPNALALAVGPMRATFSR